MILWLNKRTGEQIKIIHASWYGYSLLVKIMKTCFGTFAVCVCVHFSKQSQSLSRRSGLKPNSGRSCPTCHRNRRESAKSLYSLPLLNQTCHLPQLFTMPLWLWADSEGSWKSIHSLKWHKVALWVPNDNCSFLLVNIQLLLGVLWKSFMASSRNFCRIWLLASWECNLKSPSGIRKAELVVTFGQDSSLTILAGWRTFPHLCPSPSAHGWEILAVSQNTITLRTRPAPPKP